MKSLLAVLVLATPLTLTSCEGTLDDILGEWSRPVPSTVVEDARVLGAAVAKGAIVTVTYKVGNTTYTAKFEKIDGDNYKLISNTQGAAGARAMTRALTTDPEVPTDANDVNAPTLTIVSGKLVLVVKATNGAPLFEAQFKIETGETTIINTNALGTNCTIGSFAVNDDKKEIKNPEMQEVTITFTHTVNPGTTPLELTFKYAVQYSNGEKWSDVVARYKDSGHAEIGTYDDYISIQFDKEIAKEVIKEAVTDAGASGSINETTIDGLATTVSQIKLYLQYNDPTPLSARAMTRMVAMPVPVYVKSTEAVGTQDNYYLDTKAPLAVSVYKLEDGNYPSESNETVMLGIPAVENLTWKNIRDANNSSIEKYGSYYDDANKPLAKSVGNIFIVCNNELVFDDDVYDPNKTYEFWELKPNSCTITISESGSSINISTIPGLLWKYLYKLNDSCSGYLGGCYLTADGQSVNGDDSFDPSKTYIFETNE